MIVMSLGSQISEGLMPLVDLVYPPRCPLCGTGIARHGGLCATCWGGLVLPGKPACAACDRPLVIGHVGKGSLCAPCLKDPPRHAGISAAALYNDTARQLILSFKHGGRIGLTPLLARLISARLGELAGDDHLVVPVPLHRWRLWQRGYNQAALLAREISQINKIELAVDALVRKKSTQSLGGLGRTARKRTLRGSISVNPKRKATLRGRDVILVDDVLTSGATSDACVSALMSNGVNSVRIACFARVLDESENAFGNDQSRIHGD